MILPRGLFRDSWIELLRSTRGHTYNRGLLCYLEMWAYSQHGRSYILRFKNEHIRIFNRYIPQVLDSVYVYKLYDWLYFWYLLFQLTKE